MLEPALEGIIQHHERLDGSGYPLGLHGPQNSRMGRIVAVADVFDAMTSDGPYRPALSVDQALSYLHEHSDAQFDADCVQALYKKIARTDAEVCVES